MYRKFFGLNNLPFKITPDTSVFYTHGSREDILSALVYTVTRGDGIVKVTGEVGCGKTMLLRLLASSLPESFSIVYINSPNLSAKDMLLYICSELGLKVDSNMMKFSLLNLLTQELLRLHALGRHVVMLIDEAQAMTFDTLEEIRLLSNIETNEDKLLQIVLFGQPELDVALEDAKIRQLKSRISYSIYIPPLNTDEVNAYLNYRMRKSDYDGLDLFGMAVSKEIHRLSGGYPRAINIIADKLLMSAYSTGDKEVSHKHINMLPELELPIGSEGSNGMNLKVVLISLTVFLASIAGTMLVYNGFFDIEKDVEKSSLSPSVAQEAAVSVENSSQNAVLEQKIIPPPQVNSELFSIENLYAIDDEQALVQDSVLLRRMLVFHARSKVWLKSLPSDGYVIQLSSPNIKQLDRTIEFYKQANFSMDSLHLLIDSSLSTQKFRLKVFYHASQSYPDLMGVLKKLPEKIKDSSPYVTTVKQLVKNLEYTENKLKLYGIRDVSQ